MREDMQDRIKVTVIASGLGDKACLVTPGNVQGQGAVGGEMTSDLFEFWSYL